MKHNGKILYEFGCEVKLALEQAVEFLTILPPPRWRTVKREHKQVQADRSTVAGARVVARFFWLEKHGWSASFCGLLIGATCGLCAAVTSLILPSFLCACLTLACGMILTGGLHEDGLADTADALGVVKARRVRVMEDSRIGSFAVLALLLSFALRAAALTLLLDASLQTLVLGLLLVHASARSSFPLWFRYSRVSREASLARSIRAPNFFSVCSPLLSCCFLSFILLPLFSSAVFLLVMTICSITLLWFFAKFFEGVSGDLCGSGEQVLECVLSLCLCAFLSP